MRDGDASQGEFQGLLGDAFLELEQAGKVKFSKEARISLVDQLTRHCTSGKEVFEASRKTSEFDAKSRAALAKFERGVSAALLAINSAPLAFDWLADLERHVEYLDQLRSATKSRRKELGPRSGRPPNQWYEFLVVIMANAYKAAGGTVSAAHLSGQARRETPFLRIMRYLDKRLPVELQAGPDGTVDSRVADYIERWREWCELSNGPPDQPV